MEHVNKLIALQQKSPRAKLLKCHLEYVAAHNQQQIPNIRHKGSWDNASLDLKRCATETAKMSFHLQEPGRIDGKVLVSQYKLLAYKVTSKQKLWHYLLETHTIQLCFLPCYFCFIVCSPLSKMTSRPKTIREQDQARHL